jgi:hypothetical protein
MRHRQARQHQPQRRRTNKYACVGTDAFVRPGFYVGTAAFGCPTDEVRLCSVSINHIAEPVEERRFSAA